MPYRPQALLKSSKIAITALAIGIGAALPVSAQSLQQAMVDTYNLSPSIQTAQAQALQSIETYNQAVAQTKIQVTGSASNTLYSSNAATEGATSAQVQFSQNLFQGSLDGIPAGIRQALGGVSSAQTTYKNQEMSALSGVVNAYMGVLRDEGALGVATSGVETAQQQLEAARARLDAGEGTRTDVALAEAGLAQAQSSRVLARSALDTSISTFVQVVGSVPNGLIDPGFPSLPATQAAAIDLAMEQHPSIKGAEIGVQSAEDSIVTTRAQYGLNLSLSGSVARGWDSSWNANAAAESETIQLSASIPLFDSGIRQSAIRNAEQNLVIAQSNLENQKSTVRAQVTSAWSGAQAQIQNLQSLITVANAQEIVLEATKAEFDAGTATFLQVQTAQQNFDEAQDAYVQAKAGAVISAYNVLLAIGGMTTEVLDLPVSHFDVLEVLDDTGNRTYMEMLRRQ